MRPIVSYDDIATPQNNAPTQLGPLLPCTQPPAKRRRTSHQKPPQKYSQQQIQHWDDPGGNADVMHYDDDNAPGEEDADESRELTHDEIWDDSALIEAWNSATAEYEAYHGKSKKWKDEPLKKSPLWYNAPPTTIKVNGQTSSAPLESSATEDSAPHNFDTYVPMHDPSLAAASAGLLHTTPESGFHDQYLGNTSGGQDEAFSRALSATYWAGYWTAVYHYHRNRLAQGASEADDHHGTEEEEGEDGEVVDVGGEEGDEDDLISTQR